MGLTALHRLLKDFANERKYEDQALEYSLDNHLCENALWVYYGRVLHGVDQHDYSSALVAAERGEALARKSKINWWVLRFAVNKARVYAAKGDESGALKQLTIARQVIGNDIPLFENRLHKETELTVLRQIRAWKRVAQVRREYLELCGEMKDMFTVQAGISRILNDENLIRKENPGVITPGYTSEVIAKLTGVLEEITKSKGGEVPNYVQSALGSSKAILTGVPVGVISLARNVGGRLDPLLVWRELPAP